MHASVFVWHYAPRKDMCFLYQTKEKLKKM